MRRKEENGGRFGEGKEWRVVGRMKRMEGDWKNEENGGWLGE